MKSKNEPIVLSGRVYLDGILAEDNFHLALPAKLVAGDIKLHNVNRAGSRQRFGRTISFSGFIVGSVYDGKKFRRLLMRKLAACESTHTGPVARRETASAMVRFLRTLVRRQAIWVAADHGFEVTRTVVPEAAPAPAQPAVETKPVVAEKKAAVTEQPAAATPANHPQSNLVVRKRRSRRKPVDTNQLELFGGGEKK